MQSFGYTFVNYFESENGQRAAVETATHHVVKQVMKLNFPQVFIFEVEDGHIMRMQAFVAYLLGYSLSRSLHLSRLKSV